jgi:hypothetical protein
MVGDAISSVLRQTYPHREILVVDDESNDETAAVLAGFGDAIRVMRQPHAGAGVARNRAIDAARGEFIAFLDSDDEWLDFKLELQVAILNVRTDVDFLFTEFLVRQEPSGQVLHSGARRWHESRFEWRSTFAESQPSPELGIACSRPLPDFTLYSGPLYRDLIEHYLILPTTAIVRRSALEPGTRFAEGPIVYEDWEFFARLARNHAGGFVDLETAVNRGHKTPGRLTLCSTLTKLTTQASLIERVFESDTQFMAENAAIVRSVKANLFAQIAREALLDARPDLARSALKKRRTLKTHSRRLETTIYSVLAHTPGGSSAARLARKARDLATRIARPRS